MKKRYILLLLSFTFNLIVCAQEYKPFKAGIACGLTLSGILITIEADYRISDDFVFGFRNEGALIGNDGFIAAIGSFTLLGQYYLSDHRCRPFIGAGFGIYPSGEYNVESGSVSPFGVYPRLGFDVGHFSMSMDYNLILLPKAFQLEDFTYSYLGIRLGVYIGGGKKKPSTV